MDKQTNLQIDKQTNGQTDKWTNRQINIRQMDKQTCEQMDRQTNRQTDGQADGQTDRWTDRQIDRLKNRTSIHSFLPELLLLSVLTPLSALTNFIL